MDRALLDAFRATDYLVCIDAAEWADIRIDQPLPSSLQALVGARCWGFITAWNPRAETTRAPADNLAAQRELLGALRAWPEAVIHPAIGIGRTGWSEPSLFVIGPDIATLDALARRHEQLAYIHGHANSIAHLRVLE
ncbi:hypothetical protein GCM10008098_08230 [Rhodanobacter panaciterrae]|uniref:DUF3293 domain-containing protein n=1 Tax=Rhodanobacter panaciterrae TaxID=490572 RepID=A0ABQ2ZLK2_9GAMM|nr:DUF3293 domain-containing protein [Rhodanobacter panaciterrae]GGY18563.1 hypothetical protein GCM10008098_08230 [Rhodanobacter panaciterrae]